MVSHSSRLSISTRTVCSISAWHGMMFADEQLCGKPMKTIRLCNSTLEASLYLKAFILNGKYQVKAEYNSNEYSQALISQFLESYEAVVKGFLSQAYLCDVDIATASQREVLDSYNQTDVDYDDTQTIVSLFRHQAATTPDNVAVVFKDKKFTYAEVDAISDRIAGYIASKGLGLEDVVSVLIPRCEWMVIASLGVLKAGCAYQPLDPSYPKERLNFMMQDANARNKQVEFSPINEVSKAIVLLARQLSSLLVVGHLVGIVLMLRHWFYANNHLHFTHVHEQPAWGSIISQGAPLAVASICLTLLLLSANSIVLSSLGRTGIFAFAVCMNLLQIYNLFLSGTCRTLQSLGAIQVGKGDQEAFRLILRKAFGFISVAMILTCVFVWIDPQAIALLFGADGSEQIAETDHALSVFSLSFIPFCYIYVVMIVYKLYKCHKMALFISFALSLTVIPVMWLMARLMPDYLWYSYLIAYVIEILAIVMLHKMGHLRFEWAENAK